MLNRIPDPRDPEPRLGNLPGSVKFDVYLAGVPSTLLNKINVSGHASVVVQGGFGKTAQFGLPNDQPLPRGEYSVIVVNSDSQDAQGTKTNILLENLPKVAVPELPTAANIKLTARKTYFLGGAKDQFYSEALAEFHELLQMQLGNEYAPIKWEDKWKNKWEKFSIKWLKFQHQLREP